MDDEEKKNTKRYLKCGLCNSTQFVKLGVLGSFVWYRCRQCGNEVSRRSPASS